jgi:hypothetical protein
MVDEFKKLESDFKATQKRFKKAKTLDEKRKLLVISWKIISDAKCKIAEFKAQVAAANSAGTKS